MKIEMTKKAYLDIAQFYDFLHSDNGLIEGFFLKPDGETKATQYFDNKDEFIQTVDSQSQRFFHLRNEAHNHGRYFVFGCWFSIDQFFQ